MKKMRNLFLILAIAVLALGAGVAVYAQAPAPAATPPAAAAPPPAAPASPTTAELAAGVAKAPTTADLAKGDPGGTITGTINDVPVADPKAGLTLADVANQVGQNKIAVNFVWTLVTGFLVMFMQAGFRHGRIRPVPGEEREPHVHDELLRVHGAVCSPTGS